MDPDMDDEPILGRPRPPPPPSRLSRLLYGLLVCALAGNVTLLSLLRSLGSEPATGALPVQHVARAVNTPPQTAATACAAPPVFRASKGDKYFCACSCAVVPEFKAFTHPDRVCPLDNSVERHRFHCMYFHTHILPRLPAHSTTLHIAPEHSLVDGFGLASVPGNVYITGDHFVTKGPVDPKIVMMNIDIQHIPFNDAVFDFVICNHVLEHVPDDRLAMSEFFRVMKPGAVGIITAPMDLRAPETLEDASATSEEDRLRLFGQKDHVRKYGFQDFPRRLRAAGFVVEEIEIGEWFRSLEVWPQLEGLRNREFSPAFKERVTIVTKPS